MAKDPTNLVLELLREIRTKLDERDRRFDERDRCFEALRRRFDELNKKIDDWRRTMEPAVALATDTNLRNERLEAQIADPARPN